MQLYILNYYAPFEINKEALSQPELIGIFSDYSKAWKALEQHAKQFPETKLDLSTADMGAIILDDGKSESSWVMGSYGLEEAELDKVNSSN